MQACKPLADYARFVKYVRMNQADGLALPGAVDAAVDRAIREDLLDGFFRGHKAEVVGMLLAEYNEEQTQKNWFEDGKAEGRAEGRAEMLQELSVALGISQQQLQSLLDAKES